MFKLLKITELLQYSQIHSNYSLILYKKKFYLFYKMWKSVDNYEYRFVPISRIKKHNKSFIVEQDISRIGRNSLLEQVFLKDVNKRYYIVVGKSNNLTVL